MQTLFYVSVHEMGYVGLSLLPTSVTDVTSLQFISLFMCE